MYTSRQNNSALGFRAEEAKKLQIHFAGKGFLITIVMACVIAFVIAFANAYQDIMRAHIRTCALTKQGRQTGRT